MNKQDLVRRIAADAEVSQREASVMLDSMVEIIMTAVASGEKVQLAGFGTFEKRERQARTARNPQTGEPLEIPAATVPDFHAGTIFKERVDR